MRRSQRGAAWLLLGTLVAATMPIAAEAQLPFPSPQQPVQPQPPVQPQAPAQPRPLPPSTDPRPAQIRAGLERAGMRVLEVVCWPDAPPERARCFSRTAAAYAQPSEQAIITQAMSVWWVMYNVLAQDPPALVMFSSQIWNKYDLQVWITLETYNTFLSGYRTARTDNEKRVVFQSLLDRIGFRVWDLERGQFVDQKDFINKNFTR